METGYIVVCTTYPSGNSIETSYGIAYVQYADEDTVILKSINDLTVNITEAQRLVMLCNKLSLDPSHLTDIAEDYLAGI